MSYGKETMMGELAAVEQERAIRRQTWRVLRRDSKMDTLRSPWVEEPPLTGEGPYGFTPSARDLGVAYGEGDYILIEDVTDAENPWRRANPSAVLVTVVADTVYRERRSDEDAEDDGE